jgi:hypothetical protein
MIDDIIIAHPCQDCKPFQQAVEPIQQTVDFGLHVADLRTHPPKYLKTDCKIFFSVL